MILTTYLILLPTLILWIWFNGLSLPLLKTASLEGKVPKVSILVPMRNESKNVLPLLDSLKSLTYPNIEFLILDDNSEDDTGLLLADALINDARFYLLEGKALPDGWVGKVYACHQLSEAATGDYLLYLDADVRVHPDTVQRSLAAFQKGTGLVTGFPQYPLKSILGHLLVPMQHFIVFLHLPVLLANKTVWAPATAAHGAYMVFKRDAYDAIGGHKSVKGSLVEDIHIARNMKKQGYKTILVNNTNTVRCYMYSTSKEVWSGFSKNLFPGLGQNWLLACLLVIFYSFCFIAPLPLAIYGIMSAHYIWIVPFILSVIVKSSVDAMTKQKTWLCVLMPFSAISLITLLSYSMYLGLSNRGFSWKGRTY